MLRNRTLAAVSILATLICLSVVPPAAAACQEVLAQASTTWIEDSQAEVGSTKGLLNGSFYLNYDDEPPTIRGQNPNMVIVTDQGEIRAFVSGTSDQREDGSWVRELQTDSAEGTGSYAGMYIFLEIDGTFRPGDGGNYEVFGKICPPGEVGRR
jgi:hypothetical protein